VSVLRSGHYKHGQQSTFSGGHSPESQLSVNVGGSVINLVFLPTDVSVLVSVVDSMRNLLDRAATP